MKMKQRKFISLALGALALVASPGAQAQSTYSNAVASLNPVGYWPLTEAGAPSPAGLYVATNLGTLAAAGQGYYQTWWQTNGVSNTLTNMNSIVHIAGAIAGDSDTAMLQGQLGEYVVIPRSTNGVPNAGVTLTAPFAIEAWIYPTNASANTLKPIISEGFNSVQATNAGYLTTTEGTTLGMYSGFLYYSTFNGPNSGTKTEIDAPAGGGTLPLNHWYHIVAMFDGTTMSLYTNGVLVRTAAPGKNIFGQNYVPDPVSPLVVGGGNEPGGGGGASDLFGGGIDEVAIYNNVLTTTQITNHWATGTNSARVTPYWQVITNDHPAIYLRLDEPAFTGPSAVTAPVANNYGSLGAAANGYYLSGAAPGAAGPAYAGFGAGSSAVALNGFNSVVDIGGGSLPAALNPTTNQPETVTAWFKGNPADCVTRFQTLVGHSAVSWRVNLDNNAGVQFNPGNGPQLQFTGVQDELNNGMYVNDGNWHFVAAVSDGTNDSLYLDGRLAKSATGVGSVSSGSPQDLILGGDPQYLVPLPIASVGPNRDFDGSLAQVAIFTNALTASQIQGIYGAAGVPPSMVIQPTSQALDAGTVGSIPAVVGGSSPSYQWYYQGGGTAAGQTTASLTFSPVTTGSAGSYYLVATNNWGAVTSAVIQVTVFQPGSYAYAVEQLKPAAYWPLNETNQPPQLLNLTAVNYGTVGAAGNGEYGAWYQPSGDTWFLTNNIVQANAITYPNDGSKAMVCQGAPGQYVIVPRNTNGVANAAVTLNPPFSIEAWLKIGTTASALGSIVSQGGTVNLNTGGPNPNNPYYGGLGNGWAGVEFGQYQDYLFLMVQATNAVGNKNSELDTSGYNLHVGFTVGQWVHVVATFDGTTEAIWTNGILCKSKTGINNSLNQKYVVDPTTPLMIGAGSDVTASYGQSYIGTIHDVAIYNSVLPQSSMQTHFQTAFGTNATYGGNYTNAVLADSPILYYRLNDPQSQVNAGYPSGSFPVATNFGVAGVAGNGVYQPGVTPGVAGPPFAGFGSNSTAVAFNGWLGGVDVGGGNLQTMLNPTGIKPLTVVSWFQTGPADSPGRFQEILGHGDNSYRLALGQNAGENHFNPGPGPELQFTSAADVATNGFAFNDGNWHMAAGVSDGTNDYLYLDGRLARSNNTPTGINIVGSPADLLIGGDSQYTYANWNTANTVRTFDGQVAQVAYFTNALSASQIQLVYGAAGVPLTIVHEPALSVTNNVGTAATITVGVFGSSPMYQWYATNVNTSAVSPVANQTNASLVFSPAILNNSGYYFVIATNAFGSSVTSSVAQLIVVGPPLILAQSPTNIDVFAGTSPTLHVTAQGPGTLAYQWSSNGVSLAGATAAAFNPSASMVGTNLYTCVITNTYGAVTNSPIIFAVITDPAAPFPAQVLTDGPVAYYRLDEASGTTAYDYIGGNNATYTNVTLGMSGYTSQDAVNSDPTETAAGFGFSPPNDYAGNVPNYLNFSAPSGSNAEFSVEAWITQYDYQNNGNCIVELGYGGGGEQFVLDTGNSGGLRFFVHNAAGAGANANSTNKLVNDGLWHHVVGVCDEAGGHIYVYLDGKQVGSAAITAGSGLLNSSEPLTIGARESGNYSDTNYDFQFYGSVDDVAVYNKALSAGQVQSHYLASGIPPLITGLAPSSNVTTNQTANVVFTVGVSGTAPFAYQWLDNNYNPIPWGTNATLVITNVQPDQAGTYTVNVTNYYGGPVSTNVNLTVSQVPQLISDITPSNLTVYATVPVSLSVSVSGTPPLSYQWYENNGTAISNATNATYAFPAVLGTNTYYLSVTNIYSAGSPLLSSTATVVGMPANTLNPTNYTDHLAITFAGYNRGATLSDFPVLVRLSTNVPGFNYSHFASTTGNDLRFTDSGGTRVIPCEIDQWNLNGESTVWVQVSALSGTNSTIWAYWGNPANTTPLPGTNVWVPQPWEGLPAYDLVYHLKEGAFPFADSTGQNPALTGVAPAQTTGVVGTGAYFNGTTTFMDAGFVNTTNQFTVSAWVNIAPNANSEQTICCNKSGGWNTAGFDFYVNGWQTNDSVMYFDTADGVGGAVQARSVPQTVGFGQWHLLSGTMDGVNGAVRVYVDGVDQTINTTVDLAFQVTNYVRFGSLLTGLPGPTGAGGSYLDGSMDETRIHAGIESSNWVWASWMTVQQNSRLENYSAVSSTAPVAIQAEFTAGNLNLSGVGGSPGATYYVVGSTNLTLPVAQWTVLATNTFSSLDIFNVNVPVNATTPALFLRIRQ